MRFKSGLYVVVFGAITSGILVSASAGVFQNNSWTNASSGKWEDGTKWSLGVPPALGQLTIFVTNAVSKTVTIDTTTSGSFATNMTINDLTIGAPAGSVNTLLFQNPGTLTPFNVLDSATLTSGGVLTMDNAVVNIANQLRNFATLTVAGGSLNVSGDFNSQGVSNAVWVTGGQLAATGGNSFIGRVTVSNGTFLAHELFIGNPGQVGAGTLTVAGGLVALPVSFNGMVIGSNGGTGAVWQTGGQIITTNTDISIGGLFSPALGQMTVSNGTLLARNVFVGGQGDGVGTLTVAGGTVSADLLVATSSAATIEFPAGIITLSGALITNDLDFIVGGPGQTATLKLVGGTNNFISEIHLGSQAGATGMLWMTGGLLIAGDNLSVADAGVGQMTISNGTLRAAFRLDVATSAGSQGTLTVAGGTNILGSFLELATSIGATGTLWMTGGQLIVTNSDGTEIGLAGVGNMTVSNGIWQSSSVIVSHLAGSAGTLKIAGGTNLFTSFFEIADDPSVTGTVWMTGGQLIITNRETLIGNSGVGRMTVSNGTWQARDVFVGDNAGSRGTLTITGGSIFVTGLEVGTFAGATGAVWMTGGQLTMTNADAFIGDAGFGQVTISNGTWLVGSVILGDNAGSHGTLTLVGGTTTLSGNSSIFYIAESATVWMTGGHLTTTNATTFVGDTDTGQMTLSNGTWLARDVVVGDLAGSQGTLTVAGGTNIFSSFLDIAHQAGATGTVWLTGGQLTVTNDSVFIGDTGVGRMTVSNGTWVASHDNYVGHSVGSQGTLTIAGGTNMFPFNLTLGYVGATGTLWMTGGQLTIPTPDSALYVGVSGVGLFVQSNGTAQLSGLAVPGAGNGRGTFLLTGGNITVDDLFMNFGDNATGTVIVTGGQLNINDAAVLGVRSGSARMTVSNGTVSARSAFLGATDGATGWPGILTIAGGVSSIYSNLTLGNFNCTATGTVMVTGGSLFVTNGAGNAVMDILSGTLTVSSGLLQADKIVLTNACAHFTRTGGTLIYGTAVLNPTDDSDGDGFTNQQEINAGTDPLDPLSFPSPVTSWTDGTGKWEVSTNWSAGAPSSSFQAVFVTNAASKTVTIDATTTGSFPGTMTISNLTVSSPAAGATNTLALVNAGLAVPLHVVNTFTILDRGVLTITNSAMFVEGAGAAGLAIENGNVSLIGGSLVSTSSPTAGNLILGNDFGSGQMTVSGGSLSVGLCMLGKFSGSQGTLTISGGTNIIGNLAVGNNAANTTGTVWMTGGLLTANFGTSIGIGGGGVGKMAVSNGSVQAFSVLMRGPSSTLTMAGGALDTSSSLQIASDLNSTSSVWITGGQLTVTNGTTSVAGSGAGQMTVSNGTCLARDVSIASGFGNGTLTIVGGTTVLSSNLSVAGGVGRTGTVWITGGKLVTTNAFTSIGVQGFGRFTASNGTWLAKDVILGSEIFGQGTLTIVGGTNSIWSSLILGTADCTATGVVAVTGGSLFVTNAAHNATLEVQSGTLNISGGLLKADRIVITNACAHFTRTGGTLQYTSVVLNPNDDTDGDGFTNQQEIDAGSDPLDPTSVPSGQLSVTPTTLNFGTTATGVTAQASFVVSNSAVGVLSGGATVAGGPFAIVSGSPFSLSAHGSTNVVVQFAPASVGAFTNKVIFNAGAGGTSSNTVTGTGAALPVANFTATPTNGVVPLTVTFTNTSTGSITNDIWSFGDTTTSNTMATVLTHTYNAAGSYTVSVIAQGPVGVSTNTKPNLIQALNPPHLVVAPSSRDYGVVTIGLTNTLPFSVINTGDLALTGTVATVSPFAVSGASSYTVQPGQTGTVQVSFIPTSAGAFTNNVVFNSNGGASTNSVVGTGVSVGHIVVSPATLDFGTIATSTMSQRVFVVSNSGGTTVTNGTVTVSAPFAILSGQQFSVPALGSTNVVVEFVPSGIGAFTNQVVFATANGGNSTNQVSGTGAAVPVANFTTTPTNGVVPLTVTFTNTSTGSITNDVWSFGDTTTSNTTATVLTHTYNAAGSYSVSVIAQGPVGVSTNSKPNLIHALNPPHLMVTPASRDYGAVTVGLTNTLPFSVINTGDLALTGTVATVLPFAISGASSYTVQPGQTGTVQVSFIPTSSGSFSNNVVFSSNGGASTNSVVGTGASVGHIVVSPAALDFGTIATGTVSQRVFVVSNSGGTTVTNGAVTVSAPFAVLSGQQFSVPALGSTNVVVEFAPSGAGAFTNPVVFATANGGSSTNQVTGTAAIAPVAGFTAAPTNGAAPLLVSFTDASSGVITNRLWTFGDGTTSTASLVMHTYSTAGVYSVSLMVFGPGGSDTLNQPGLITVTNNPPTADFSASPTNGVAPLLVNFTDGSTGTITNRVWDFGDGGSSTVTSPSHTYTNAGNFSVTLTVFGPTGTDALTQPGLIVVTSGPTNADLEVIKFGSPNPVFVGSNLTYTITVTNHGPTTATSVTLTDALPTSVTFSSASDECTNTGGIVVCDLGSLNSGEATNVTLVVVPTVGGKLTNTASVAATETDPVPANNTVTNTVTVTVPPLGTNDLAVVRLKAPKRIALSATTTNKVGKFSVTIQNRGPLTETIPDLTALSNLVAVSVQSLGTNCPSFSATLVPPKASFPINIAPNKKLTLIFTAIFDCANDPLASTKTLSHADYRTTATVDLGALDEVDTATSNDICPRPPSGSDPGCGNKDPVTKQPGADVLTDVVVKQ